MNFLNLLLEKPAKREQLLLLLWQTTTTLWVTSWALSFQNSYTIPDAAQLFDFDFLKTIDAFSISVFIALMVIVWGILWFVFPELILPIISKIVSVIITLIVAIIVQIIFTLLYFAYKLRYLFNKKKFYSPRYKFFIPDYFRKNDLDSSNRDLQKLRRNISEIKESDRFSKRAVASQTLLIIARHEKSSFIRTRILRYYSICLYVTLGLLISHDDSWGVFHSYMIGILLAFVIMAGLLIAFVDRVYRGLVNLDSDKIIKELENEVYAKITKEAIQDSFFSKSHNIDGLKNKIQLTLKEEFLDSDGGLLEYPEKIHFFIGEKIPDSQIVKFCKHYDAHKDSFGYVIFVSNVIPDTASRNLLRSNNIDFIYAESHEQVLDGINKLRNRIVPIRKQN